jgi:osmotically-inducible protein OsmY
MASPRRIAITTLSLLLLAGCKTVGLVELMLQERQYEEDRLLAAEIEGELAADPHLAGAGIEVDVFLKEVTLRGPLEGASAERARQIARAVPLVEEVAFVAADAEHIGARDD